MDERKGLYVSITIPPRKCKKCGGPIEQGYYSDRCAKCDEEEEKKHDRT